MTDNNGKDARSIETEDPVIPRSEGLDAPSVPGAPPPLFATRPKSSSGAPLAQNKVLLLAGGAVAVALLLFVFASAPSPKHSTKGGKGAVQHQNEGGQPENSDEQKSMSPVIESIRPPVKPQAGGLVGEQDVAHTATRHPAENKNFSTAQIPQAGTLGSIPPFDNQAAWQAPPYQASYQQAIPPSEVAHEPKVEHEQPSLVFVQKPIQTNSVSSPERPTILTAPSIGLPIGTRLRARLESAASTAVKAPVIAVIEYNYEKDGEIIVPAGTKAFGRIEQADRTGYLSIRFDALLMPDGTKTEVDAVATNLRLGPLRGKVEGRHTGKNLLVRSVSGLGEVGALLVSRTGSVNQPFSEGDVLRERIGTNIGESGDQTLLGLTATEHIVVTIYADTPVYLILDRNAKQIPAPEPLQRNVTSPSTSNLEALRQLLQLQRELNQNPEETSH